ncbi:GAF domain-containing sensor histidine kinase [Streptomyces sp. NBC_01803]|uniref:GAF domain-containing sensor histidine kinase n=1 Tax=Streptomyces sp. NBC_01803 TaxID=2975946 RepID=UPI002DD9B20D|nr:GAF domain-containing protein [Streptomyces sp. NBC_01803]WSA46157.1 GAF domain-containing protein [Streptomyces sp. NBC_01803]
MDEDVDAALRTSGALDELIDERHQLALLLDRVALLRRVADAAREAGGVDIGMVGDPGGGDEVVLRGLVGVERECLRDLVVPRGLGLGGKAAALLRPVWVQDYVLSGTITHDFDAPVTEEGLRALLALPMRFGEQFTGVLYVGLRRPARFGDDAITRLQRIADEGAERFFVADRLEERTEAAVAAERARIAAGLHDSVGAMLFTAGAELRDLRTDPGLSPQVTARLRSVERRIAEAASLFRESLAGMDDTAPRQELHATLVADCKVFGERTGIVARCVVVTPVPELDAGRRGALVGVAREALLNVEKHARASSVVVSLAGIDGGVSLAVADDGVGWNDDSRDPAVSSGRGLPMARERLERLGGSLSVVSDEDGGLTVRGWLP